MTKYFFSGFIINMDIDSISFGATPLNKVRVKRLDSKTNKFKNIPAYFVRLDAKNKGDLIAANSVAKNWKGAKYIKKIATASHWMNVRNYVEIDVYALTTQSKEFENLNPNLILGMAEIRNNDVNNYYHINHLQVKPEAINVNKKDNKYKYIGSSILSSLKKVYKSLSLDSEDDKNIEAFYRRNGFFDDYTRDGRFIWHSDIIKRIKLCIDKFLRKAGI